MFITHAKAISAAGTINVEHIKAHWEEMLRLVVSIRSGTSSASAVLRRFSAYPRQNGLAVALREIGRIERSLFTMDWLKSPELHRRAQASLNKGEARNALAHDIFFHSLGELRFNLFPHLTALENIIEAPIHVRGMSKETASARALELMRRVGLEDKADYYPEEMSGGHQQRTAIARALAMDPKMMLFDEPASALDLGLVHEVLAVMRGLRDDGVTMIIGHA